MKLLSLNTEAFGSFASPQSIIFREGLWYIIAENRDGGTKSDSNGSGKTTILNAICWALYGKTPQGLTGKHVTTHGHSRCRVCVTIGDAEPDLIVTRTFTAKGQSLQVQWKNEIIKGDLVACQKELERIVEVNYHTFCSTIFLGKGAASVQFLYAPPAKRSEILSDLVDDSLFQAAGKILKKQHDDLMLHLNARQHAKSELLGRLGELGERLSSLQRNLEIWEDSEKQRIEEVKLDLVLLEERRERALASLKALALPPESMDELAITRGKLASQKLHLQQEILAAVAAGGLEPSKFRPGQVCPSCCQPITADSVGAHEARFRQAQAVKVALEGDYALVERKIGETDLKLAAHRNFKAKEASTIEALEEIKRHELFTRDKLSPKNPDHLKKEIGETRDTLNRLNTELTLLNNELNSLPVRLKMFKDLYLGFSTEVRNVLFDAMRDSLEAYTADYLKVLTEGDFKISFPTKAGEMKEKFEIVLYSGAYCQDLSAYSEGEAWRASFSVLLALRRVLADKSRRRLDFLLIDDPIGGLDVSGVTEFCKLLQRLVLEECDLILATVPRDDLFSTHGNSIKVVKEHRRSFIEEPS